MFRVSGGRFGVRVLELDYTHVEQINDQEGREDWSLHYHRPASHKDQFWMHCPAHMSHVNHSRPDCFLGFHFIRCKVWDSGFGVSRGMEYLQMSPQSMVLIWNSVSIDLPFRVWGLGFGAWGLGFGVWGLGFVV
jgi:hypothetical protein